MSRELFRSKFLALPKSPNYRNMTTERDGIDTQRARHQVPHQMCEIAAPRSRLSAPELSGGFPAGLDGERAFVLGSTCAFDHCELMRKW